MSVSRYFHTIRHLRPVQIYGRLLARLPHAPRDVSAPPPRRRTTQPWQQPAERRQSLLGKDHFCFLNVERELAFPADWDPGDAEKLWTYNLHYFDDLNAAGAAERRDMHRVLIERWVADNMPGAGIGWEPYPTSLRIVNWIKWSLSGAKLPGAASRSIATQARHLSKRIESHLLGNHVFANAKALLFAGLFFDGHEARMWREKAASILRKELDEQVLDDGGHFERSPMYHSIVTEDVLDCINVMTAYGNADDELTKNLMARGSAMINFLGRILHSDGELPFFNDTALGISPSPQALIAYAQRLGSATEPRAATAVDEKRDFGLWIFNRGDERMIVDAGPIGPDYLPGHAHCDTLSYEMSVSGRRFIVNSGVYTYQGSERPWFRSTAAHNTVRIDGEEQHEVWAAFRVARRGYPIDPHVEESGHSLRFSAGHTGYTRLGGKPVHTRTISYDDGGWRVEDVVTGNGSHEAESFVHLHPDVEVLEAGKKSIRARVADATMRIDAGMELTLQDGDYSPEFGRKHKNRVIVIKNSGPLPLTLAYEIRRC